MLRPGPKSTEFFNCLKFRTYSSAWSHQGPFSAKGSYYFICRPVSKQLPEPLKIQCLLLFSFQLMQIRNSSTEIMGLTQIQNWSWRRISPKTACFHWTHSSRTSLKPSGVPPTGMCFTSCPCWALPQIQAALASSNWHVPSTARLCL